MLKRIKYHPATIIIAPHGLPQGRVPRGAVPWHPRVPQGQRGRRSLRAPQDTQNTPSQLCLRDPSRSLLPNTLFLPPKLTLTVLSQPLFSRPKRLFPLPNLLFSPHPQILLLLPRPFCPLPISRFLPAPKPLCLLLNPSSSPPPKPLFPSQP